MLAMEPLHDSKPEKKYQVPTDFHFPLRPNDINDASKSDVNNKNNTTYASSTPVTNRASYHSRVYTGIDFSDLPVPVQNSNKSSNPKKHAHRRSAAISHDFDAATGLGLASSINFDRQFTESWSTTTDKNTQINSYPSIKIEGAESTADLSPTRQPKVQFAPEVKQIGKSASNFELHSKLMDPKSQTENEGSHALDCDSWSSFKFGKSHKKSELLHVQQVEQKQRRNSAESARKALESPTTFKFAKQPAVSTTPSLPISEVSDSAVRSLAITPMEPLIDLDVALNPFKYGVHRRTESAPEFFGPKLQSSRLSGPGTSEFAILEEEDEGELVSIPPPPQLGQQPNASVSASSLNSMLARDKARAARNYKTLSESWKMGALQSAISTSTSAKSLGSPSTPPSFEREVIPTEKDQVLLQTPPSTVLIPKEAAVVTPETNVSSTSTTGDTRTSADSLTSLPESQSDIFEFGEPGPELRKPIITALDPTSKPPYDRDMKPAASRPDTATTLNAHPKPKHVKSESRLNAPKRRVASGTHNKRFSITSLVSLGFHHNSYDEGNNGAPGVDRSQKKSVRRRVFSLFSRRKN